MEKLRLSRAVAHECRRDRSGAGLCARRRATRPAHHRRSDRRQPGADDRGGGWMGATRRIPLPGGGLAEARVRDGGNCFNLNSVVEGDPRTTPDPAQFGRAAVRRADDGAGRAGGRRAADRRGGGRLGRQRCRGRARRAPRTRLMPAAPIPIAPPTPCSPNPARRGCSPGMTPEIFATLAALALRAADARAVAAQRQHADARRRRRCWRCSRPARSTCAARGAGDRGAAGDGLGQHDRILAHRAAERARRAARRAAPAADADALVPPLADRQPCSRWSSARPPWSIRACSRRGWRRAPGE